MRARKRPRRASDDDVAHRNDASNQDDQEFHRSSSSRGLDKDGYVQVELAEIREKVQCPLCLGIIWNTMAVKECLHRFCQECIAKYMLLGSNECPASACHAHCGSNSLRADPRYDALIEAFYPDAGKSKELAFHEEKMTCKNQVRFLEGFASFSKKVCSFRFSSVEGASFVPVPTPLAEYDAMRSKPIDTSTIPSVDSQKQLEGITNAITQTPSIGRVKTNSPFLPMTKKTKDHSSPGTRKTSKRTMTLGTSMIFGVPFSISNVRSCAAVSKSSRNTPGKGASKKHSTALPTLKRQKDEKSAPTKRRGLVLASSPNTELGHRTAVAKSLSTDVIGTLVSIDDILVDNQEMSNAQMFYSADQDTVQAIDLTTITDTIINPSSGQEIITSVSITAFDIPTDDQDHPQRTSNQRQDDQPTTSDSLMGSAIPSDTRSPRPLITADYIPPLVDSAAGNEPVETVLARSAIAEGLAMTTVNPSDPTLAAVSESAAIPSSVSPPVQLGRRVVTSTIPGSSTEVNKESASLLSSSKLNNIKKLMRSNVPKPTLTPLAEVTDEITTETVRTKWMEYLDLTRGGYSSVLSSPASEARAKESLADICAGNRAFTKTSQFRNRSEDFMA